MVRIAESSLFSPSLSKDKELPTCRICYSGISSKDNPLIRPCKCSGSMKFIHKLCLQKWRMWSAAEHVRKCPVCKQDYQTTTLSLPRKMFYFYALPGLQSIVCSCCISYVIGYFMCPVQGASRAYKAICFPPFTPSRKAVQPRPIHPAGMAHYSTEVVSKGFGIIGPFMKRAIWTEKAVKEPLDGKPMVLSNRSRKSSWMSMLRNNKHLIRFFAGQYNYTVWLNFVNLGMVVGLDRYWEWTMHLLLIGNVPEIVAWLFDRVVFEYIPFLEKPIQALITGEIFINFVRVTKFIYDHLLTEFYVSYCVEDVRDLNDE